MAKKAAQNGASTASPLDGCVVATAGTFPGTTQAKLQMRFTALGATVAKTVTAGTDFLVATQAEFEKHSIKVKEAISNDIPVVTSEWIEACESSNSKADEKGYLLSPAPSASAPKTSSTAKKRPASPDPSASPPPAAPSKKQKKSDHKPILKVGEGQLAKSTLMRIPLDEGCSLGGYQVYIDHDGLIFDASLNQTNSSNNNNKFYRVQLLYNPATGDYKTWTRWGRVGDRGQSAVLGSGSLSDALSQFEKKFQSKSGLKWTTRGDNPKPGKYAYIEKNYNEDSDSEDDAAGGAVDDTKPADKRKSVQCTLDPSTRQLMELIFNQTYFAQTMSDLNYDANKLPLGKLSKATISRGFQALKDLAALLDDQTLAASEYELAYVDAVEHLSNLYYSLIPHAFGRNRPPVIASKDLLKKEIELLDNLGDMKEAAAMMKANLKDDDGIHPLDRQFKSLGMDEMEPLDNASREFEELSSYLNESKGATHNLTYEVQDIFRIQRQGELDRFDKSKYAKVQSDRRLLWHGSRVTNFGGILGQGLRIAPPEAPVSGYMFGKGIYLADMSSKSANYCSAYSSGGTALLLLCEAELGAPMQELKDASYSAGEDAKAKGLHSTWGKGSTGPSQWKDASVVHPSLAGVKMPDVSARPGPTDVPGAYLQYNEYICYDVAQVRLRYLLRVKM